MNYMTENPFVSGIKKVAIRHVEIRNRLAVERPDLMPARKPRNLPTVNTVFTATSQDANYGGGTIRSSPSCVVRVRLSERLSAHNGTLGFGKLRP